MTTAVLHTSARQRDVLGRRPHSHDRVTETWKLLEHKSHKSDSRPARSCGEPRCIPTVLWSLQRRAKLTKSQCLHPRTHARARNNKLTLLVLVREHVWVESRGAFGRAREACD